MNTPELYPDPSILDYDNDGLCGLFLRGRAGKLAHYRQSGVHAATFETGALDLSAMNVKLPAQPFVVGVNNDGRLDIVVGDGAGGLSLYIDQGPASVTTRDFSATDFRIEQLSPNPCAGTAALVLDLRKPLRVIVAVYDVLGREVPRPMDGVRMREGSQHVGIELQGLPAGSYSVVVSAEGKRSGMMLLKK